MQTAELKHTKKDDLVSEFYHEWGTEIDSFLGTWNNVNPKTGQISRMEVTIEGSEIFIHCFGILEEGEMDWGPTACQVFSSNVGSQVIEGFTGDYEFEFMNVSIIGNIKYGVMVVQSCNTFKDGSNRNNYLCREFFCK
jgi:hypothetical protein